MPGSAFINGGKMKASQLIAQLQAIIEREGSDPICCSDLGPNGPIPVKETFFLAYEPDPSHSDPPKWRKGQPLIMVW